MQSQVSDPNDLKVVSFHNSEEFDFTPDLGCMFDGRPINGTSGAPGIQAGETIMLPYHVGHRLAVNLAKRVFNTSPAATVDEKNNPVGKPIWNATLLQEKANEYIKEMYSEERPIAQSQTDLLMARVEALNKMVVELKNKDVSTPVAEKTVVAPKVFLDKQEVIAELEKRGVKFDRRTSKENLEKLLV